MKLHCLTLIFALSGLIQADVLRVEKSSLTGEVLALQTREEEKKVLRFQPKNARQPIELDFASVEEVAFAAPRMSVSPMGFIRLMDGDCFPGTLEGFDSQEMRLASPVFGELSISDEKVSSYIALPDELETIPKGSISMREWHQRNRHGLYFSDRGKGVLSVSGNGFITSPCTLPNRFVISTQVTWRNFPDFSIQIITNELSPASPHYGYRLNFVKDKLALYHRGKEMKLDQLIAVSNRTSASYKDKRAELELRVDLAEGMFQLLVNGADLGTFIDPKGSPMHGARLKLGLQTVRNNRHTFDYFTISPWREFTKNVLAEVDPDAAQTQLIGNRGEVFTGSLLGIYKKGDSPHFRFRVKGDTSEMILLEREVAALIFPGEIQQSAVLKSKHYLLKLHRDGIFHISDCEIEQGVFRVAHPELGALRIDRGAVDSLRFKNDK